MPDLIITDALVERCAQAADDARSDRYGLARRPLACLTEALHPAPTPGPLDGQEPLIRETT